MNEVPRTSGASSLDDNDNNLVCPAINCRDILLELYWYIKRKGRSSSLSGEAPPPGGEKKEEDDHLIFDDIVVSLEGEGILFWRDHRLAKSQQLALSWAETKEALGTVPVSYSRFVELVAPCATIFLKAFNEENVIPDWGSFVADMKTFFEESMADTSGQNAQYIPVLRDADPDRWGVSFCSVDGQRFSLGDSEAKFSLQSVSKPVTYAIGLATEGEEFMEEWIDVEPAGRPFNTQDLDPATQRPFNASLNSGAIMAAGIVASGFPTKTTWREIVDKVVEKWKELCGNGNAIEFSGITFESEKATAYNNFAIAYNLKGRRGLPRDVDLHKMLDVYLGCCSIEITAEALSVAAATLANGGICPITEKEVFPADVVRTVLAETMTCGLYDQAGRFAVEVGLPAKSGVSGALLVMVPGVFGFSTFSPRLNQKGNSVRGIDFCKRLVKCYRLHIFEPYSGNNGVKIDPRKNGWKDEQKKISHLAWAASVGDENAVRLRNIFLYALIQVSMASKHGLSKDKMKIIQKTYKMVFLTDLDPSLFQKMKDKAQAHKELEGLEKLMQTVYVTNSMRGILFDSMVELAMSDGFMDEGEKEMTIKISVIVLGMCAEVAALELGRYERKVGHRFEGSEIPGLIEKIDLHGSFWDDGRSVSMASFDQLKSEEDEESASYERKEEAFLLRKTMLKLGQRLSKLKITKKPQ
jgi:glutaminase